MLQCVDHDFPIKHPDNVTASYEYVQGESEKKQFLQLLLI